MVDNLDWNSIEYPKIPPDQWYTKGIVPADIRSLLRERNRLLRLSRITEEEYKGVTALISSEDPGNWEMARLSMKTFKRTRVAYYPKMNQHE